jgi:hypothetical protein
MPCMSFDQIGSPWGIYESVGIWGKTAVKGGCRRGTYNAGSHLADGVKGELSRSDLSLFTSD